MPSISDREYLLTGQYWDASNVNAQIRLHERFSVNRYGWHRWIFDQFQLAPESRILELGCGPGSLWGQNLGRISRGWDITLSDFSSGMVQAARQNLQASRRHFEYAVVDAQSLPFGDASHDAIRITKDSGLFAAFRDNAP